MIVLPAIDIQAGNCVRLLKGDFATVHKVAENPMDTAAGFRKAGASWIHMVDLDGAKNGSTVNTQLFVKIAASCGLKVELGGGIRSMETIAYYLESGISRVILGSVAVKNPSLVREAVNKFGDHIAVGIDAKNGKVATEGWLDTSNVDYLDLAKKMEQAGVKTIIYTDIAKDGTLQGANLEQLAKINEAVSCNIIASGGVRNLDDINACKKMGLYGVICGKSIYSGSLSLKEAIALAGEQSC